MFITVSPTLLHTAVALVLAVFLPLIGIIVSRDAMASTRKWGLDDSLPRLTLLISIVLTVTGALIVVVGFTTSVVVPVLSALLR